MKDNIIRTAVCPLCGRTYHGAPALSREDNKTLICPDCGTRQALQSIGVKPSEQEQILETIHRHMGRPPGRKLTIFLYNKDVLIETNRKLAVR